MPDSFIDWLEPRLTKDMRVYEWGSGNSTLWLSNRVGYISTIEHHVLWYDAMIEACNQYKDVSDVSVDWFKIQSPIYVKGWDSPCHEHFHLVVIDGVRRDECIYNSVRRLTSDGVIILDNSDSEAKEGQQWLRDQGFSEKVFSGEYAWGKNGEVHTTTIFFKSDNCLGLIAS